MNALGIFIYRDADKIQILTLKICKNSHFRASSNPIIITENEEGFDIW
jgi:hypothetical protein